MKNVSRKIELLANLAIVFVAISLGSVLISRYVINSEQGVVSPSTHISVPNKTPIRLDGVDWSKADKTLVMVLSTTCRFCTESGPFYRKLANARGKVRMIAVLPQSVEEGRRYLEDLGVDVSEVVQAPLSSIGVTGTPTLVLVSQDGTVTSTWLGKPLAPDEANLLLRVQSGL